MADSPTDETKEPKPRRRLASALSRLWFFGARKKDDRPWWKPSLATMLAFTVLIGGLGIRYLDPTFVELIRLRTFDAYNRMHPRTPPNPSPVVIIDFDEKSLDELGQWPWPRTVVGDLIAAARDYQMAVIGFDVTFVETDRTSPERMLETVRDASPTFISELKNMPSNEEYMANVMRTMRTVVGQAGIKTPGVGDPPEAAFLTSVNPFAKKAPGVPRDWDLKRFVIKYPTLIHNVDELEKAASGRAFFSVDEEVDGVVRRVPLIKEINGTIKPTLSLEMLRVAMSGNSIFARLDQGGIRDVALQTPQGNFPVPTDGQGRIWVYFAEPDLFNTENNTGRMYVSATDIYHKRLPPERLAGRIGLVGTSAVGLLDIRATPIAARLPGVEVHANIIENIMTQEHVSYPVTSALWELIAMIGAGLLLIFFIPRVGPIWTLGGLVIAVGGLVGASWYMFTEARILLDVTYPSGLTIGVYAVMTFANYMRDAAEKRQVRTAFSQYLSPDLVNQLAENPDQLVLGGETKKMTLLFCDVRGFTTISEQYKTDPQGLTRLINRLLTPLTNEILRRNGTIDKYMGDCIMAFWNAPVEDDGQEGHSVESALAMFTALDQLNEEREREAAEEGIQFLPLKIGIGINTGECVVGNMGSEQRFDYSVLGDAVNLAARLEGQSKSYGVEIVLGPDTAAAISDGYPVLELDLIAVKGKTEAVQIFTVTGGPDARGAEFDALRQDHDRMLVAFRAQNFDEADRLAQSCKGRLNGVMDEFYDIYRERIAEFRLNPPPQDWDGVYVATTK